MNTQDISSAQVLDSLIWKASWPDGLLVLDAQYKIQQISPKATHILGYACEQAAGVHIHELLCPVAREYHHSLEQCPLTRKNLNPVESHSANWQCLSGDLVNVDYRVIHGDDMACVISFHQNDSKSYNQQELSKFAQYVENSPTPMAEFDPTGQMIFANPAMQHILLEHDYNDQGESVVLPADMQSFCNPAHYTEGEVRSQEIDLGERCYSWHFFAVNNADMHAILAYLIDITDKKLSEQKIEKEKADARRDFYAKMVHELRTPLNAIIGFSQILMRRGKDRFEARDLRNLKSIHSAGLQLNEMVSDTLDISKIEAGKMDLELETFDVVELMGSLYEQLNTLAEAKSLTFTVTGEASLTLVSDRKKVRQILVNLVSNAIKYTNQGQVEVALNRSNATHHCAGVLIVVTDTGMGIADDQIDKLFDSYQRVKSKENRTIQGTGLGLALVAELINMLNGTVEVTSQVDVGSRFQVELPQFPKT